MSSENGDRFEWKILHERTLGKFTPERKLRLGVLISGSGSNLQALIDAIETGQLPNAEIVLVISNVANAQGVQRALKHKLPVIYLPWRKWPTSASLQEMSPNEMRVASLLHLFEVDLVVLAGWMRILSSAFVQGLGKRMINLHPALLPAEGGSSEIYTLSDGTQIPALRGLHVVQKALDAGLKATGSTVHYVTAEVDAGPVICQQEVPILPDDTEDTLHERLKAIEHQLIVKAVRQLSNG